MINARSGLRRAVALGSLVSLTACYTDRPLQTPLPPPSTRIVAQLTDSGMVAMGGLIGGGALAVEGVVTTADPSTWDLELLKVEHRDGRSIVWNREVITFPRSVLTNLSEKKLDRTRSWLFAGALTVGTYLATRAFGLASGGGEEGGEPVPAASVVGRP